MPIYERGIDQIMQPVENIIGQRAGMDSLLALGGEAVAADLAEFDNLLDYYNCLVVSDVNTSALVDTPFLLATKQVVKEVPLVGDMLRNDTSTTNFRAWLRTLHTMDAAMQRSESDLDAPNLGFAIKWPEATPRERLLGGIFHGYGLFISHLVHPELPSGQLDPEVHQQKSDFLDALIEVAAIAHQNDLPNNPLHRLSETMGWYDVRDTNGNNLFSDFIRKLVGKSA